MRQVYWVGGKSKANTLFLYGEGGETGYTGREDLNSLIVTTLGMEGKVDKGLVFPLLHPRPSLVSSALSSLGHHMKVCGHPTCQMLLSTL